MKVHSYIFSLLACISIAAPLFMGWSMKSKQGSALAARLRSPYLWKSVRLTAITRRWLSALEEK